MNKCLIILILAILSSLSMVAAQNTYFDIGLECYQGCNEGIANIDEQIILELSIVNNFDYWIYIGDKEEWDESSSIRIIAENSNLKDGKSTELYQFVIGNPIYIPPKSEDEIYIPLDAYNSLPKEDRIGDWSVKVELSRNYNTKYYENPFNGKTVSVKSEFQIPSQLTTNLLKFEAKKEEVVVEPAKKGIKIPTLKQLVSEPPYSYFTWIIGLIIVGIIVHYATKGKK